MTYLSKRLAHIPMKSIRYNLLNQPDTVQFRNGSAIVNYYTADGKRTGSKYLTPLTTVVIPAGQTFGSTSGTAAMSSHVTTHVGVLWNMREPISRAIP